MERKLYTDSFERMLKEKSDEFRMYPSKNTWHSLYNNLYPGKRWPSNVMSLFCLSVLLVVGYLNNSGISIKQMNNKGNSSNQSFAIHTSNSVPSTTLNFSDADNKNLVSNNVSYNHVDTKQTENGLISLTHFSQKSTTVASEDITINDHDLIQLVTDKTDIVPKDDNTAKNNVASEKQLKNSEKRNEFLQNENILRAYTIGSVQAKRWTDKLTLQVYASPSIVYGSLSSGKTSFASGDDANNQFNENPSLGLEAGTAMQYALSGFLKLKAGVQFNYASYNLEAYQNDHPAMASLISTDPTTGSAYNITSRASLYSMNDGNLPVTLHNETYQLSLPVGLELKLLKNHNLQWNAGATIQPTFIAGGNAYMLSSDNRNYVDASSALNRWNLNAGFETFITYKVNGLVWQLGPQIRYQFLSIYGKGYTGVDERLANYGVKIGISKAIH